jgi:two-component system response regulator HydG
MDNILVIDDDMDICMLLQRYLSKNGFNVSIAYTGKSALENIENHIPDIILCDFRLEDMTGGELLEKVKGLHPEIPVIIMTGYSDVRTAVNIMKFGAFDYVTKPLLPEEILLTLKKALDQGKNESIKEEIEIKPEKKAAKRAKSKTKYIFGKSSVFKIILDQIHLVAPTNYSVIIYGESGSGKESVAHEIHSNSTRADKPFIAIDCGALSKELAGSELFGHEKGAFTGALNQKIGSFELANGGTIFLDEISNLSYELFRKEK